MSDAIDNHKDELAAGALSRLADPPVPEGMAARIAARATAVPQVSAADAAFLSSLTAARPEPAAPAAPVKPPVARWRAYLPASIAAAALLSIGLVLIPAEQDAAGMRPQAKPPASPAAAADATPGSVQLANAVPEDVAPSTREKAEPGRQDAMPGSQQPEATTAIVSSAPPAQPAVQIAEAEKPAAAPPGQPAPEQKLAQFGPPAPARSSELPPVPYGPPAPAVLAAAGAVSGPAASPAETGSAAIAPQLGSPATPPPAATPYNRRR